MRTQYPVCARTAGADIVHEHHPPSHQPMSEIFDAELWLQWFSELDRTFIFLLLLPFVVAVVGLWAAYRDREIGRHEERRVAERRRPAQRPRMGGHRYNE
jgi:hypothetical protein